MAFTGAAVVKQISDRLVRITGISLAAGAVGTIGLAGKTVPADVQLPADFKPRAYETVTLQDSVQAGLTYTATGATLQPVGLVKTGATELDFVITATHGNGGGADTGALEIYVAFH